MKPNGGVLKIETAKKDSKNHFSYLAGINRAINPAQVTKLAASINLMGVIRPIVVAKIAFITGKLTTYIIDGQHLFNALLRNNMDFPYVVIEIKDKQELVEKIALLNASSKTWSIMDYVTAWSSLKPDYVKLNHLYQVYDLELSVIASIMSNGYGSNRDIGRKIKDGTFTISNEEENVKTLDFITDILKIAPRMDRVRNNYVVSEYVRFLRANKSYDHKKFKTVLTKHKDKLVLITQEEGKLSELFNKIK